MSKHLYVFWGASAGLCGWLMYKMWKEKQKYTEISDKIHKYGVLGVSELKELQGNLTEYELEQFNSIKVANEHTVMVKGEFNSSKPFLSSKSNTQLIYHVSNATFMCSDE